MEIETKISFRHGFIARILKEHGITFKQLSMRCGWKYENLMNFIRFAAIPTKENKDALISAIKELDSSATYDNVFPEEYAIARKVLHTRVSTKEIPCDLLVSMEKISTPLLTSNLEEEVVDKISIQEASNQFLGILNDREKFIIKSYYGIGLSSPKTLEEIGVELHVGRDHVRVWRDKALRKMYHMKSNHLPEVNPNATGVSLDIEKIDRLYKKRFPNMAGKISFLDDEEAEEILNQDKLEYVS